MTPDEATTWLRKVVQSFQFARSLFTGIADKAQREALRDRWADRLSGVDLTDAERYLGLLERGELPQPKDWGTFPADVCRWAKEQRPLALKASTFARDETVGCAYCRDRGYGVTVLHNAYLNDRIKAMRLGELVGEIHADAKAWYSRSKKWVFADNFDCSCDRGQRIHQMRDVTNGAFWHQFDSHRMFAVLGPQPAVTVADVLAWADGRYPVIEDLSRNEWRPE